MNTFRGDFELEFSEKFEKPKHSLFRRPERKVKGRRWGFGSHCHVGGTNGCECGHDQDDMRGLRKAEGQGRVRTLRSSWRLERPRGGNLTR